MPQFSILLYYPGDPRGGHGTTPPYKYARGWTAQPQWKTSVMGFLKATTTRDRLRNRTKNQQPLEHYPEDLATLQFHFELNS